MKTLPSEPPAPDRPQTEKADRIADPADEEEAGLGRW